MSRSLSLVLATRRALLVGGMVLAVLGCSGEGEDARDVEAHPPGDIPVVTAAELARMLDSDECAAVDANTGPVRTRNGTVPDAVRLSHYRDYDLAELPPDRQRPLVFYCANERCTASDVAARRAARAGWRQVSVMRSGIAGWTAAGHPTQPVP